MNPISINSTSTDTNARTLISTIASSLNAAQYALDVVEVWRQRSNRLPHSIESTAMLVTAIVGDSVRLLHDLLPQPCTSLPLRSAPRSALRSVSELRSTYSLAILRSVNGLVDANNQGGGTKRSVASLASNINLPAWLVDLRHDISHNEMPSLMTLRVASTTLVEYFSSNYFAEKLLLREKSYEVFLQMLVRFKRTSKVLLNKDEDGVCTATSADHKENNAAVADIANCSNLAISTEALLTFLVHGDESLSKSPGVLLSGKTDARRRFKGLIVALQRKRQAFSKALLSCLVLRKGEGEGEGEGQVQDEQLSWISYLLSRDYLSNFEGKLGVFKGSNLREKSEGRWKGDERAWMEGRVKDFSEVEDLVGYDLNLLVDMLDEVGDGEAEDEKQGPRALLVEALGNCRKSGARRRRRRSAKKRKIIEIDNTPTLSLVETERACDEEGEGEGDREEEEEEEEGEGEGEDGEKGGEEVAEDNFVYWVLSEQKSGCG